MYDSWNRSRDGSPLRFIPKKKEEEEVEFLLSFSFYQPFRHSFIVISQFNRTKSEYTRVMESIRLSLVLIYRISIKFYYSSCEL
jgi:hypothetical protein